MKNLTLIKVCIRLVTMYRHCLLNICHTQCTCKESKWVFRDSARNVTEDFVRPEGCVIQNYNILRSQGAYSYQYQFISPTEGCHSLSVI
jgi:hypothetical protein